MINGKFSLIENQVPLSDKSKMCEDSNNIREIQTINCHLMGYFIK